MSADLIAQIDVLDMEEYGKYLANVDEIFKRHRGKTISRSLAAEVVEGE